MTQPSPTVWKMVDCATQKLIIEDITAVLKVEDYLLISHFRAFSVWDISDPLNMRMVSENRAIQGGKLKLCGDRLLIFGKQCITLLSTQELPEIHILAQYAIPESWRYGGTLADNELYITHRNGVAHVDAQGGITMLVDLVNQDDHFGRYPSDLECDGDYFYVVGRHAGLNIYRRQGRNPAVHVKTIQSGFTPTDLYFNEAKTQLFLVGNEDFIQIDVSNPEKAKRYKSCKFPKVELAGQFVISGDEFILAGTQSQAAKPRALLGVVTPTEKGPILVRKMLLDSTSTKHRANDGVLGIIAHKSHLILAGYYKQVEVYEPH